VVRASLEENLKGAEIRLSAAEIGAIGRAFSGVEVTGERYPPELQKFVER
jgi:hypothetical protein